MFHLPARASNQSDHPRYASHFFITTPSTLRTPSHPNAFFLTRSAAAPFCSSFLGDGAPFCAFLYWVACFVVCIPGAMRSGALLLGTSPPCSCPSVPRSATSCYHCLLHWHGGYSSDRKSTALEKYHTHGQHGTRRRQSKIVEVWESRIGKNFLSNTS